MDTTMSAPVKLLGYVALLVIIFFAAYAIAGAVVPAGVVENWNRQSEGQGVHTMTGSPTDHAPHEEP